jgi:DNA modification methylase
MKPYYEDEFVTLYLGTCVPLDDRPEVPVVDAWLQADVLVTDPPYGTASGRDGADGYGRRERREQAVADGAKKQFVIANDADTGVRDRMLELWGDRPALVFGSPRLPDPPIDVADRLVWDKRRPGTNGGPWRYRHESIFVTAGFVRVDDGSFSILSAFPDQQHHIHGKPVPLMEGLIEHAPPGVIADPFAGSLSTLVAARNLGRRAIGVELEEVYCELAAVRFSQTTFAAAVPVDETVQGAFEFDEVSA